MNRDNLVLAALAAGGVGASYSPVQVQKLLFLLDREVAALTGGPHFDFQPYDYGPFDSGVYAAIEGLRSRGSAEIVTTGYYRRYLLTEEGFKAGILQLDLMDPKLKDYIQQLVKWIRSLSFNQLVAAIYNRYPDMKVNSVFRG
jgi:uncharacterized protein YwgA